MEQNIYIGAKYLPTFDGEWRNDKKYEPLTFVTMSDDIYLAIHGVPAGIPVTNDFYWIPITNYSDSVGSIETEMLKTIDTANAFIDGFNDSIVDKNLDLYPPAGWSGHATCKLSCYGKVVIIEFNIDFTFGGKRSVTELEKTPLFLVPEAYRPVNTKITHIATLAGGGICEIKYDSGIFNIRTNLNTENVVLNEYPSELYKAGFTLAYIRQ